MQLNDLPVTMCRLNQCLHTAVRIPPKVCACAAVHKKFEARPPPAQCHVAALTFLLDMEGEWCGCSGWGHPWPAARAAWVGWGHVGSGSSAPAASAAWRVAVLLWRAGAVCGAAAMLPQTGAGVLGGCIMLTKKEYFLWKHSFGTNAKHF